MKRNDGCCIGPGKNTGSPGCNPLSGFFSLSPVQFALLSSLIGILLIDDLDIEQLNSLGNFLVGVGQNLLTAAAQGALLESTAGQDDHLRLQLQAIKKQICELEKELDK